jgi:hypothetical protein
MSVSFLQNILSDDILALIDVTANVSAFAYIAIVVAPYLQK